MHIPDGGFVPFWQCIVYYVIIIVIGYFAIRWVKNNLDERKIPLLAVFGAGIFAIQTINIPLPVGSDLHIIGTALVAILLGSPYASFLVMLIVIIIQSLIFGDGGVTTLGVNVLNMGVIGSFLGYYLFKRLKLIITVNQAVFIACFLSVFIAAIAHSFELFFAGTLTLQVALLTIGLPYLLIGIVGEGTVSTIVYIAIKNLRPDLISED
ncbi:MAG: cobalt transporter CbiM [Methanobrevibacter sp.]|jgi:cobalt/nickel transport system permease protein|nr:cobalt transporter CbiM [Candidatus Methanovirga aequatorialis]